MASWTNPTTRTSDELITATIWNTDLVENLKYLKDAPAFAGNVTVGGTLGVTGATTLAAVSATTGAFSSTVTGGTYNGQTISSAASLTGTLAVASTVTAGTYNGQTISSAASLTGTLAVAGVTTFAAGSQTTPALTTTGDTNTGIFFPAADTIAFGEGGAEAMRVDSGGNLLVGYTAADARFIVAGGASSGWGGRILQSSAAGTPQGLQVVVGQNATNEVLQCGVGTSFASVTNLFKVTGSGEINTGTATSSPYNNTTGSAANLFVTSGGTFQRSTSSRKYKTGIHDATHGLPELLQLRPVTYCGINDGPTVFGGLIAEDVHDVGLSEFVQYAPDGTPDALAYGPMVSLAIKAIQEQQALITALTARVTSLEGAAR